MDKATSESEKIIWPKRQCGLRPDLVGADHILPVAVDPDKPKDKIFFAGYPETVKRQSVQAL